MFKSALLARYWHVLQITSLHRRPIDVIFLAPASKPVGVSKRSQRLEVKGGNSEKRIKNISKCINVACTCY